MANKPTVTLNIIIDLKSIFVSEIRLNTKPIAVTNKPVTKAKPNTSHILTFANFNAIGPNVITPANIATDIANSFTELLLFDGTADMPAKIIPINATKPVNAPINLHTSL